MKAVTKKEILSKVAKDTGLSRAQAKEVFDSLIDNIAFSLSKGKKISLVGFGTFSTHTREARIGRNPRTGEKIQLEEVVIPKFKPGKNLKMAVNQD